nr:hypothetical protein [Tanacetum cinerariifolium]
MTEKLFAGYTGIKVKHFRETQLLHMGNVKKSVVERTRHKRQYARRMKERQMQSRESKVVSSKALDASLVVTECSGTKSDEHITSSSSGTHIIQVVDADITPVNEQVPSTKVQSHKTRNKIKPIEKITNVIKPKRWISKGYRISPNKSFVVHEKPNTPRSCLSWKPMSRILKTASFKWIPTGNMFTDCTTKVDSEPPNGLNEDITNPYECDQTLNVSACTLNLSAGLVPQPPSLTPNLPPTKNDWDTVFCTLFDEYFNPPPRAVSPVLVAVAAPRAVDPVVHLHPISEETTLQGFIPSNLHHLNQSFDILTKLTKIHPLENVIGDPSRPSQRDLPRDNPLVSVEVLRETIKEGSGVGIILISPEEKTYSYAIRLKFSSSNHDMDYEALLTRLAVSVSTSMKDLHVFIDLPKLVSQTEGNNTPATEQERKYKKEIMDATAPYYRFQITHLPNILNSKAEVLTGLATIKFKFLNQEVSVGIKTRPSVEETSISKKGKAASNAPREEPIYNRKASRSN